MKKFAIAFAGISALAIAACGPQDAAEDVAEEQFEAQEDILEEQADLADEMGNEAESDMLDAQADAAGEMADEVDGTNLIDDSSMTEDAAGDTGMDEEM